MTFSELNLSDEILQAVTEMGFEIPSPIQEQAIPHLLQGLDVIGQAQTGTGKTAAFGIPALEFIDVTNRAVQTLVLCPTRELAVQVTEEIRRLAKYKRGVTVDTVYGGDSIERQIRSLKKGCHIVVGTPGRVMDHMERRTLKLDQVKMIILDEADEMLDMGFREDIENILLDVPKERQTVLFSATMSKPIMAMTQKFQKNPVLVKVVKKELTNENIEQLCFEVKQSAKVEVMCRLIDAYDLKLLLVFCNTKRKVDEVVESMKMRGYAAEGIHGDLRQSQRTQVMAMFRSGKAPILVATDVAARGIDVTGVDAVINLDLPLDEEYYVHRIGRTGRAGLMGKAFTLVGKDEKYRLRQIQEFTKVKIEKGVIPTFEDIVGVRKARFISKISEAIQGGDLELYDDMLTSLQHEGFNTDQVVSALVKLSLGLQRSDFAESDLAWEDRRDFKNDRRDDRRSGGREERGSYGQRDDRGGSSYGQRDSRGGSSYGQRDDRGGSTFGRRDDSRPGDRRAGERPAYGSDRPSFGGDRPSFGNREDRGAPRQTGPRGATGETGMVRLFVSVGRRDRVRPNDIVGAIAGEANIPGKVIGSIDIHDEYSFVEVPERDVKSVITAMSGNTIKGVEVSIEVAK